MNFIFFWRLVREKGFDLIVSSLRDLEALPGNFFIFGDGPMRSLLTDTFRGDPRFVDASSWSEKELDELVTNPSLRGAERRGNLVWKTTNKPRLPSRLRDRNDENNIPPWEVGQGGFRIYFFSWRSKDAISRFLAVSHFSLMPSRFLETFGLSALESLAAGVPVIAFRKGWLVPFVDPSLTIVPWETDKENAKHLSDTILHAATLSDHEQTGLATNAKAISERYTEERWMSEARTFLGENTKKILLVSDYIAPLGGIESHVSSIAKTLREHGYEVETFGWHIPVGRFTRLLRLAGLVISCYNPLYAWKFRAKLADYRPDCIWFHNVSRFLGPAVVCEVFKKGTSAPLTRGVSAGRGVNMNDKGDMLPNTAITYHELGIFTPFPSATEDEDAIPRQWSLSSFLARSRSLNLVTHTAIVFKFLQLTLLRDEIKKIRTHIVPSDFMRRYVRENLEIPEDRIVTLEHYRI